MERASSTPRILSHSRRRTRGKYRDRERGGNHAGCYNSVEGIPLRAEARRASRFGSRIVIAGYCATPQLAEPLPGDGSTATPFDLSRARPLAALGDGTE